MPRLHIPRPCPADRSKMPPTEQGRYCELCQKEVIDFSCMSDAEIRSVLAKSKYKVCASLREDQVGRYIGPVSWPKRWFALGLGASLLGPMVGMAQTPSPDTTQSEMISQDIHAPQSNGMTGNWFWGKIVNENHEPLVGATVVVKGTEIEISSTGDGHFEFENSDKIEAQSGSGYLVVAISHVEYLEKEFILAKGQYSELVLSELRYERIQRVSGGITGITRWQRFWWWITRPFRW